MITTNTKIATTRAGLAAALLAAAAIVGGVSLSPIASAVTKEEAQASYDACLAAQGDGIDVGAWTLSESIEFCCGDSGIVLTTDTSEGEMAYDCIPAWESVDEESSTGQPDPNAKPGVPDAGLPAPPPLENPGQPAKPGAPLPTVPKTGRA